MHHTTEQQQEAQNVKNLFSVQKVDSKSPLIPTQITTYYE